MNVKEIIKKVIGEVCETQSFSVERPADITKGDFATNVAMVMAKEAGKNPREFAEEIVQRLKKNNALGEVVDMEKIEVAGPGFINFWVKDEVLVGSVTQGLGNIEGIGNSDWARNKRVLVEFSSPNIAKRFSVGHLRSTIIGQALFNLYKASGAELTNDNHLGDWGTQFGMIVAAVEEENLDISSMSIGELEELYVRFNKRIEERPELREKAKEAFLRLEQGDQNARKIWQLAIDVSMAEFNEIYKKLNVSFENMYGESSFEGLMPEVIEQAKKAKVSEVGEKGAVIVKFEKDGKEYMSPAMLVKGDGSTTYFTRDLATIKLRLTQADLKRDLYVYEVGSEQKLHMRQVFDAAKRIWPKETEGVEFVHVAHGLMSLPEGKMSTRKGNTVKLEDLITKAGDMAKDYVKSIEVDVERMGLNAIKYNELRRAPASDYVFVWDEALAMEGNSAPYINYAYVRAKKISDVRSQMSDRDMRFEGVFEGEEKELARLLIRFLEGEVVEESAKNFAPHLLAGYLFELAKKFNAFYDHNKVLGDEREEVRLALVGAVKEVIKKGMSLLGVEVVEKM